MRRTVVLGCVLLCLGDARAESWYEGEHGTNRVVHLSLTTVGLLSYPLLLPVEARLVAEDCRWCEPTGLDRGVRDALVWSRHERAAVLSDLTTYGAAPALAMGIVTFSTFGRPDRSWAHAIDDLVPVAESLAVALWATRATKLLVGRQRPYAHFDGPLDPDEDNQSFPSAHTSTAFALVTSAAMITRARGYRGERVLWAAGLTVAAASGYFRIAADRHYMTDVLVGATIGTLAGLTVPLLMRRVSITPTRDGLAVAGDW